MNHSNLTRWLVTCVLLLLIGVIAGYQFAPTPASDATRPSFPYYAYEYLDTQYDLRRLTVKAYHLDNCAGMRCQEWLVQPNPESLNVLVRCYVDTQMCVIAGR